MTKNITDFILNRRLAHVKRYHSTPMHQNETVAEHSFYVAIISRAICGLLEENGEKVDKLRIMEKALVHDMEEMFSGDIPQPFKHSDPHLRELINKLNEKSIDYAFEGLPISLASHFKQLWMEDQKGDSVEDKIVKVADRLSLIAYCLEQIRLGNRFMVDILDNGINLLRKSEFEWLGPILEDVEKERETVLKL